MSSVRKIYIAYNLFELTSMKKILFKLSFFRRALSKVYLSKSFEQILFKASNRTMRVKDYIEPYLLLVILNVLVERRVDSIFVHYQKLNITTLSYSL